MIDTISQINQVFDKLWPICRSITGPGYRESLDIISESIPFERLDFNTGEKIFDWSVPKEWVVRDAYLVDPRGKKFAEFKKNNLHLMGYSAPYFGRLSLKELKDHLHSIPGQPEAIPYVTSYYHENWGFCISDGELQSLVEGEYQVYVDTELINGKVVVGEVILPGQSDREILFSTYLCHPSMANHELSGPILMILLYDYIAKIKNTRYTYRFLICPETIGSLCYLSKRGLHLKQKLDAGYVITCVGAGKNMTYKMSRSGEGLCDKLAKAVLRDVEGHVILPFTPFGSDERQYCSPGFNLPVGSLMRTKYGDFKEYHTSLDDKNFINFELIIDTLSYYKKIVDVAESNAYTISNFPYGEPQLSKRNLYAKVSQSQGGDPIQVALMWVLNLSDGENDLIDISNKSNLSLDLIIEAANLLEQHGLIKKRFS